MPSSATRTCWLLAAACVALCAQGFMSGAGTHVSLATRSMAMSDEAPKTFLLHYKYTPDMINLRQPHRQAHLDLARSYVEQGYIRLGGAFTSVDGALFLFHAPKTVVQRFAHSDPYVSHGLVIAFEIHEWDVTLGNRSMLQPADQ